MVVAATGFFDGVHLGHRIILDRVRSIAVDTGRKSSVVTFWPHPRTVLQQDADRLRLLTSLEEKRNLMRGIGIGRVEVIPFDRTFSTLSSEDFIRKVLIERYGVSTLVLGYDHRFGHDAPSDVRLLADRVLACGIEPVICGRYVMPDGTAVSSTEIRKALDSCRVKDAGKMLGYDYSLSGVVVSGNRIGRTLGFPTANMELYDPLKAVPGNGVYQVDVSVCGNSYKGVCNIGVRPTIGTGGTRVIETHILDFNEDIYGLDIRINFLRHIRPERKFDNLEELKLRLQKDILTVRESL
ncbi:MAG: riboflavin biosynthesis protein RibF [Bacteroidales bacterium]|nr:riboflavin biosynthesis protein RibF [Candidatus Cacconaster scatequi]